MIVAKTKDLSKIYRQGELEVRALNGIDLEICEGEFTAIGVYNQFIYVAPKSNMVIVKLSANSIYGTSELASVESEFETLEFLRAIANNDS